MSSHPISEPPATMPAGRSTKSIVLGVLSIAPLILIGAALAQFGVVWWQLAHAVGEPLGAEPADPGGSFALYGVLLMLGAIASLGAFVALLIDVFTNRAVPPERQLMWVVVIVFANLIGFPVYWYVVHWRRPAQVSAGR